MKNIIYRLKFIIEKSNDKSETRNNRLTAILSSMEDIDTQNPIPTPAINTIIEIDGEDFEVISKKVSFLNETDKVFYTTIIYLEKKKDPIPKKSADEYLKELKQAIEASDISKKYINRNKYDGYLFGDNNDYPF